MAKPDEMPALSEGQLEIMNVTWELGEGTLGDVWRELNRKRPVARNTVQTLLSRLVDKGWMTYRVEGKTFHYSAAVPREATLRHVAQRLVETAFRGSTEGLVMALIEGQKLDSEEANRIRDLIDRAERGEP